MFGGGGGVGGVDCLCVYGWVDLEDQAQLSTSRHRRTAELQPNSNNRRQEDNEAAAAAERALRRRHGEEDDGSDDDMGEGDGRDGTPGGLLTSEDGEDGGGAAARRRGGGDSAGAAGAAGLSSNVDREAYACEAEMRLSLRAPKLLMLELAERVAAACVVRQVRWCGSRWRAYLGRFLCSFRWYLV